MTPQYPPLAAMVAGPEGLPSAYDFNGLRAQVGTQASTAALNNFAPLEHTPTAEGGAHD